MRKKPLMRVLLQPLQEIMQNALLPKQKKRKLYIEKVDTQIDPLPSEYRHIRSSVRKVRDDFYKTVANFFGEGLSLKEVSTAVIEVGNGMFGRKWKNPEDSEESFDIHTLPNIRNIRIALQ